MISIYQEAVSPTVSDTNPRTCLPEFTSWVTLGKSHISKMEMMEATP